MTRKRGDVVQDQQKKIEKQPIVPYSNGKDDEIVSEVSSSLSTGRPKRATNGGKAPFITKETIPASKKPRVEDAAILVASGSAAAAPPAPAAAVSSTTKVSTKDTDESGIVRKASNSHGWAVVKASLMTYKEINGNLKIPPSYVIPANDDRYPSACWNVHLSKLVQNIRYRGFYKQHTDELIEMGMEYKSRSWDNMKSALECYQRLHGHLRINKGYVVPKDDEVNYPDPHVRGMNLGMICKEIRRGKAYKAHFDELYQMGFPYQPQVLAQRGLIDEQQQEQIPQDAKADIGTKKATAANSRGRKSDRASKTDKGVVSDATQPAAAVSSSSSSGKGTVKSVRGGLSPRVLAEEEDKGDDSDSSSGSSSKPLPKPSANIAVSKRNKGKTKGGQDVLTTLPPAQSNATTPSSSNIHSDKATGASAGAVSGTSILKRKHSEISRSSSAPAAVGGALPSPSEFPQSHSSSSSSASSSSAAFTPASAAASQPLSVSSTGSKEPHNSTGWADRVRPALLAYRQLHGVKAFHKLMPATFIVPTDDANFPPNTWGIKLGKIAHNIKYRNFFREHRNELIHMGFNFTVNSYVRPAASPAVLPSLLEPAPLSASEQSQQDLTKMETE